MMFKLTYLDNAEQQGNGFADFGTLCHELLEGWAKGDIPIFALAEEYENRFDSVVTSPFPPFPKGLPQKYYEQGLEYFDLFDGFGEDYEILEVEDKFVIDIEGYTCRNCRLDSPEQNYRRNRGCGSQKQIDGNDEERSSNLPQTAICICASCEAEVWRVPIETEVQHLPRKRLGG